MRMPVAPSAVSSAVISTAFCGLLLSGCSSDDTAANPPQATAQQSSPANSDASSPEGPDETPVSNPAGAPGDNVPQLIGTWDYQYERADTRRPIDEFEDLVDADTDRVVVRLGFVDEDEYRLGFLFDGKLILVDGVPEGDGGTYAVHGDQLATTGAHDTALVTYD